MVKWNRVSFWKTILTPYHKGIEAAIEQGDEAKVDKLFESLNRWQKTMFKEFDSWHMTESETMAVCAALEMD